MQNIELICVAEPLMKVAVSGSPCASKHAALAVTNALRVQLKAQNTHVLGVYAGFIDTDMAARVTGEKTPPAQVGERTLDGVKRDAAHVHADAAAEALWAMVRSAALLSLKP